MRREKPTIEVSQESLNGCGCGLGSWHMAVDHPTCKSHPGLFRAEVEVNGTPLCYLCAHQVTEHGVAVHHAAAAECSCKTRLPEDVRKARAERDKVRAAYISDVRARMRAGEKIDLLAVEMDLRRLSRTLS